MADRENIRVRQPRAASALGLAEKMTEHWYPKVIAEVEDSYVKVAKIKGTLSWHSHEEEDELFLILKGAMRLEFRDGHVDLGEGDVYVVPKGVEHNPVADEECLILLIEKKTTLHTGNLATDKTRSIREQLR